MLSVPPTGLRKQGNGSGQRILSGQLVIEGSFECPPRTRSTAKYRP